MYIHELNLEIIFLGNS